ncbi:MAG: GntR family transcriptional regulator [Tistlia sp.]|uniref:GntR family transcriptional regulator n=1 Tax=Tistlia sp. TaxID=3057121 RepID=UPI0034A18F7E
MSQAEPLEHDFRVNRIAAPLRHSVIESIRNAIAVGRFKAGERLPERQLCEMTGVSRTLVREALRQLESEGIIQVVPHRGPLVASLSAEQARGVYQVREQLEGLAAELFARQAGEAERAALASALEQVRSSYERQDAIGRIAAKNRFYECLIEGCGNEALGFTLRMLNSRVTVLRAWSLQAPGRSRHSLEELRQLVEALLARDPVAAREAAVRHVREAAASALRLLVANDGANDGVNDGVNDGAGAETAAPARAVGGRRR